MLLPAKYWDLAFHTLSKNGCMLTDELFENLLKSPKFMSNIINELKEGGLDISDLSSFVRYLKKYYRSYWDTYIT